MANDLQVPQSHPFRHVLEKIVETIRAWEHGVSEHARVHKELAAEAQRRHNLAEDERQRGLYAESMVKEYRAAFEKVLANDA